MDEELMKGITTAVKDGVEDGIKTVKEEVKTVVDSVADIKKLQEELAEKVAKLENTKLSDLGANINTGTGSKYKGYKLDEQMTAIRERAAKDPVKFPMLSNDQHAETLSKYMIDVVKAAGLGDVQAKMDLQSKASELVEGTDSLGGYTVPVEYQNEFIAMARENSFALQNCNVINMSRDTLKLSSEGGRVTVAWEDEAAAIDESSPSFGQVTLTAKKLAGLTDGISMELLQDSAIDITGMLMQQFQYAIGLEIDNQFLNGNGSPCSGILTAAAGYSVVMSLANFSSVSFTDFSEMISKLTDADAANAKFIFNRKITHFIRSLKDSNGNPIFVHPSVREPKTVYGAPYIESSKVVGVSATSTAFGAFCDPSKFYIGRRLGALSLDSDPYSEFNKGMVRFRVMSRFGMAMGRNTAFVRLISGS